MDPTNFFSREMFVLMFMMIKSLYGFKTEKYRMSTCKGRIELQQRRLSIECWNFLRPVHFQMKRIIISKIRYHQLFSSHDPGVEVTSELSDPEDRVMVEVDEAREGWEELTEFDGWCLVTNL